MPHSDIVRILQGRSQVSDIFSCKLVGSLNCLLIAIRPVDPLAKHVQRMDEGGGLGLYDVSLSSVIIDVPFREIHRYVM